MFSSGDYMQLISMAFALILVLVIGGFILVFPIARRVGAAVDEWVKLRKRESAGEISPDELARLARTVESLRKELERVAARQEWVQSLLESHEETVPGAERRRVGGGRDAS